MTAIAVSWSPRSQDYLKDLTDCEMVGAPEFEPGAPCAQVRRAVSRKSFLFNRVFENKRVRKTFGSGTMYGDVAAQVWSPPNFACL